MKKHFSSFNVFFNSLCVSMMSLAMLLSLLAGFASCKNDLLEPPDFSDRGAYSSTDISAPEVVVATQGGFRSITVTWSPVANAVKYEVYTSQISTVAFEKRTETNGNDKVSVVIREDSDVLAYYKVKAYDKNGNASEFSKTCHGTTLGMPVITNVIQDEFGKSATVRWWCGAHFDANTYKNDVEYAIVLYADPEGTTQIAEQKMEGSSIKKNEDVSEGDRSAECTFTGLSPKTTYYYQVKAYLKGKPDEVEVSAIVDKETARRLIPNPVEELEATQGISDKKVTLSFILPDFVDVKESSDVFLKKPLYFEISRAEVEYTASDEIDEETGRPIYKEGKKPLTDYAVIATIKSAASSEWETAGSGGNTYYFDCTNTGDNTSSKKLTLEKTDSVQSNEGDAEPYIPGYKVTFTDTSAQRGDDTPPVYSYKITSYADVNKKVTSDESVAKTIGWLIGNLKMDLSGKKAVYEYADEAKKEISKITVKFSCLIEDYGKGYTYIVTQSAVDLEGNSIVNEKIIKRMDINELKDFSVVYDLSKDIEGYYSYKFYIAPKGAENPDDAYYCYDKYRTKTPVVNSKDKLLEIDKFEVEDGYSDKFVMQWSYNPDFTYELSWTPVVDGVDQELKSMALVESNENNDEGVGVIKSISNGMATFEHEAESGDVRKYTMQITSGFGIPNEFERPSYTLGTAVVKQIGYEYDKITIEWNKVQKADFYILDAWYEEDGILSLNTDNIRSTSCTFNLDNYNNAKTAGKKMKVRITAKNAKASTKSEEIPARLIGPAEVDAKVNTAAEATADSISVSWNEVEGANGYLIGRVMYSDTAMTSVEKDSEVAYYYEVSSGKITLKNGGDVTGRASVSPIETGGFTLTDTYMENDTDDPDLEMYQKAQAKISWGLPFRYVVLPVLDKDDFDFKSESLALEGDRSKVEYENLSPSAATATLGYGLNLVADKATSGTIQNIKWEEPYNAQRPVVYYRKTGIRKTETSDESNGFTRFIGQSDVGMGKKTGALQIGSAVCYDAFEYIVKYYSESQYYPPNSIDLPPSLSTKIEESAQLYDTPMGSYAEQDNKGYLLTLDGFGAQVSDKNYYEKLYWTRWDYENRAVGPDSMIIHIQNNNIDEYFHDLVTIEKAYVADSKAIKNPADDIKAEIEKDSFSAVLVAPAGIMAGTKGTTDGYLKVLRDYKHNYTFTLKRNEVSVKYEDYVGKENSIKTAYRQITDEELVRAATLAMTIGAKKSFDYRGGSTQGAAATNKKPYNESSPGKGSAFYDSKLGITHILTYTDFCPVMRTKSGIDVTFLTIQGAVKGETWSGTASCPAEEYNSENAIQIIGPADTNGLYSTELTFFWLNKDKEPRYNAKEGYKGIKISHPNGSPEKVFGNITPLPFGKHDNTVEINFQQDAEEWQ